MDDDRRRLKAGIAELLAQAAADPAGALRRLEALAADPAADRLGPRTGLGLPRKLHSAALRLAKRRGDLVARIGLQATAVPEAPALAGLFRPDAQARAAHVAAQAAPVPRRLHQIWIGGPPPSACAAWAGWAARHGWGYRLWDEGALDGLGLAADPLWQQMRAAGDLPGAVDVARYHLLFREGGLYLDCDWYPLRPDLPPEAFFPARGLSVLAEPAPRLVAGEAVLLSNAVIATPAGHPLFPDLLAALPELARRLPDGPAWWLTGPLPFTLAARRGPVTILDPALIGGRLPRGAPPAEAEAAAGRGSEGLLLAWKGW